ncbi:MAG: universal stress protein [Pseudomonadota bacterium]
MAVKSILCTYSGDPTKGSGLAHAIRVARHHDAFLTGVIRHGLTFIHRQLSAQLPSSVIDQLRSSESRQVEEIAERFRSIVEKAGIGDRAEFVDLDTNRDGLLTDFSRAFDVIVTGNHPFSSHEDQSSAQPDVLALRSGRPVLIVPQGFEAEGVASRALIAWDGKRAATRALVSAMPFLESKGQITLLSVGEAPANTPRLVQTLERHGFPVEAVAVPRQGSIAETILRKSDEGENRLIVMGAYEHSKFTQDLTGGATTAVLSQTEVPVLIAH